MPIHNLAQTVNFAKGCGTIVPAGFARRFERHGTDAAALFNEGIAHGTELCDTLRREGVRHFHFYTLNRNEMTAAICEKLNLTGATNGTRH
jgi:methylenetetrahydrofolate reductase (NADPH)